jgi:uncharacterized membrane protein
VDEPTITTNSEQQVHGAFGGDVFGRGAEAFARFFGTPTFLIGQTILVVIWIALNIAALSLRWDPYPFILLNLAFSLQAAYAAPLILLAQTRQADRDKALSESDIRHRETLAQAAIDRQETFMGELRKVRGLLDENNRLTATVTQLSEEIHRQLLPQG